MSRLAVVMAMGAACLVSVCQTPEAAAKPQPQADAAKPQPQANAAAGSSDKLICAYVELTGTRLSKRECKTQREWNEWKQHGSDALGMDAKAQFGGTPTYGSP